MKSICPFCHSSNVSSSADISSLFDQLCSPAALSAVGATVCQYYKVNPAVGAVAGTTLATAISSAKAKLIRPPLIVVAKPSRYSCNTCSRNFTI